MIKGIWSPKDKNKNWEVKDFLKESNLCTYRWMWVWRVCEAARLSVGKSVPEEGKMSSRPWEQ